MSPSSARAAVPPGVNSDALAGVKPVSGRPAAAAARRCAISSCACRICSASPLRTACSLQGLGGQVGAARAAAWQVATKTAGQQQAAASSGGGGKSNKRQRIPPVTPPQRRLAADAGPPAATQFCSPAWAARGRSRAAAGDGGKGTKVRCNIFSAQQRPTSGQSSPTSQPSGEQHRLRFLMLPTSMIASSVAVYSSSSSTTSFRLGGRGGGGGIAAAATSCCPPPGGGAAAIAAAVLEREGRAGPQ